MIFFNILEENARINRLSSRRIDALVKSHRKLESRLEYSEHKIAESSIIEYAQERILLDASIMMHDMGLTFVNFNRKNCPLTYELIVGRKMVVESEEE